MTDDGRATAADSDTGTATDPVGETSTDLAGAPPGDAAIGGRYTTVEGVRTYYDVAGPADGDPLVLVHTAGQDSLEWQYAMPIFARHGYRAYAPDLPGHGKTMPKDDGPIDSMHEFAEFVWSFVEDRGLASPAVSGTSIGGDVVLDLGVHHSDDLAAVVSCEGAVRTPTYPESFLDRMEHEVGVPGFQNFMYHSSRHCHGRDADPERVREHTWTRKRAVCEVMHGDLTAWNGHDLRDDVDALECPTMAVFGADDYYFPDEIVEETRDLLPNGRVEVLDGVGHYPMLETDEFAHLLLEFLDDVR